MIGRFLAGLINFFTAIALIFLGLRVFLRLFNANESNAFVQFIYDSSGVLMDPFRGIFPAAQIEPGFVVDFSALFAMVVYGVIGLALLSLVAFLTPSERTTTKKKR